MKPPPIVSAVLGACLLAGCGEPTGTASGRAEALIQDTPTGVPTVTGTLQGNIFASLSADGIQWQDLGSPNGITVTLQAIGSSTTVHGQQDAPTATYDRVRLVFNGVTVTVLAGSMIDGTTLTSNATLSLGGTDNRVEIVVAVPQFAVEADPSIQRTIIFELHSQAWLTAAALQTGQIEDAAIQAAVTTSTRLDPR